MLDRVFRDHGGGDLGAGRRQGGVVALLRKRPRRTAGHAPQREAADREVHRREEAEVGDRTLQVHQHGDRERPQGRADAGDEIQLTARRRHLGRAQIVVGVADAQRVKRQGQAAEHRHQADRGRVRHTGAPGRGDRRPGGRQGGDRQHQTAVEPVGQDPDRALGQHAAQIDRAHERRDLRHREAGRPGIDRAHAERGAVRHAGAETTDHAQRRGAVELQQPDLFRLPDRRCGRRAQQQRHERQRDQHADQREQLEAGRIVQVEQQLPARRAAHQHDHVDRQQAAARIVGRAVVQPAFGDDEQAGEREASHHAHHRPGCGLDEVPLVFKMGARITGLAWGWSKSRLWLIATSACCHCPMS